MNKCSCEVIAPSVQYLRQRTRSVVAPRQLYRRRTTKSKSCRRRSVSSNNPAASNAALAEQFAQLEAARAQLAFTTQAFNHAVADYNAAVQQFPTLIVCAMFGFGHAAPLEA